MLRVLRGAYVVPASRDTLALRAAAAALVIPAHAVMVDRTAAWLWGADLRPPSQAHVVPPLEVFVLRGCRRVARPQAAGGERDLSPEDLVVVDGATVTTPGAYGP